MTEPHKLAPATLRPALTRWHEEPLAWLVFGLPATVVVASFITLAIAMHEPDDLVVDDYYKAGLEINRMLAREERAAALGLRYTLDLSASGVVDLALQGNSTFIHPERLELRFTHATRATEDRVLTLVHTGGTHYRGEGTTLPGGSWYVDLSTPEWRMVERRSLP